MRARRNSPSVDSMSPYMRKVVGKQSPPIAPRGASQAEMPGMETCPAATMLVNEQLRAAQKKSKKRESEDRFDFTLRTYGLPRFERNFLFAKEDLGRRWTFDFASLQYRLAIEIEGIVVQRVQIATLNAAGKVVKLQPELIVRGRHASVEGFNEDCVKYASAAQLGWTVIRFTPKQVSDETAIAFTQRVLCARGWQP